MLGWLNQIGREERRHEKVHADQTSNMPPANDSVFTYGSARTSAGTWYLVPGARERDPWRDGREKQKKDIRNARNVSRYDYGVAG